MKVRRLSVESSGSEISSSNILVSPVTLQMQKHLLSSTIHTLSDTGKGKSMRNGSCSPTPALPYTPTPSPSPFNSLSLGISSSDLNLSLTNDTKSLSFLSGDKSSVFPSSSSSFVDIDVCDAAGASRQSSLGPLPLGVTPSSSSSADISPSTPRFSPPMELNSMLSFSEQSSVHLPVTSQQDNMKNYLLMDAETRPGESCSSLSIIPSQEANNIRLLEVGPAEPTRKQMKILPVTPTMNLSQAAAVSLNPKSGEGNDGTTVRVVPGGLQTCLSAPIKSVVGSQQLTCLTNLSSAVTSLACLPSIDTLDCLPATSSNHGMLTAGGVYDQFNSSSLVPNKKRRLLTFLAEDNVNSMDPMVNGGKRSQDSTLIINTASADPPVAAAAKKSSASTILFSNDSITLPPSQKANSSSTILLSNSSIPLPAQKANQSPAILLSNDPLPLPAQKPNPSSAILLSNDSLSLSAQKPNQSPAILLSNESIPLSAQKSNPSSAILLSNDSISLPSQKPNQSSAILLSNDSIPLPAPKPNSSPAILHLGGSDSIPFPAQKSDPSPAILLSNQSMALPTQKSSTSVYIRPTQSLNKSEQTLIINSDGTPAALITPVTVPQTQASTILAPVSAASGLVAATGELVPAGQLLQPSALISDTSPDQILQSSTLISDTTPEQIIRSSTIISDNPVLNAPTALNFRPVAASNSFTVESLAGSSSHPHPDMVSSVPDLISNVESQFQNKFVESISMFKCKLCGFLSGSSSGIDNHLYDEHEDQMSSSRGKDEDNWQQVANKEGVKLNCTQCQNIFSSDKSFRVHLTEDHLMSESVAAATVAKESQERKNKTLKIIRAEKERLRQERRRNRQNGYEAYLDKGGELRIRRVATSGGLNPGIQSGHVDSIHPGEDEKAEQQPDNNDLKPVFDMKATEYMEIMMKQGPLPDTCKKDVKKQNNQDNNIKEKTVRAKTGRPKGSRNLGITMVRKVNPKIMISDDMMGNECGVDGCAVRLKESSNLEVHRRSHLDEGGHQCPDCAQSFPTWPKCAQHLWRAHNQDMELNSCEECDYKSFFKGTMDKHKLSHNDDKPCLCPECGRAFKNDRRLKEHRKTMHSITSDGTKMDYVIKFACDICMQELCSEREVQRHKERVHEKKKEWLCSQCGYSAFSRSSIKLHTRTHTGDKPYKCKQCEYSASDHNSLRRHILRHGGVKPYQCPYCPYSAIQSTIYKVHLKKKHPDKQDRDLFRCDKCDFVSIQEKLYTNHKIQHAGDDSN